MGIYLLCSLVFVVGALLEFAVVVLLSRTPATVRKNVIKPTVSKKEELSSATLRRRNVTIPEIVPIEVFNEEEGNRKMKKCSFGIPPLHVIDFIAFWSFLFLYLLFNCTYWFHYAT